MKGARAKSFFILSTIIGVAWAAAAVFAASSAKFLYLTDVSGNVVVGYVVNPTTGMLAPNGQATVATGANPHKAASDKGGFKLYVSNTDSFNRSSNSVSAYFINRSNGHLSMYPVLRSASAAILGESACIHQESLSMSRSRTTQREMA